MRMTETDEELATFERQFDDEVAAFMADETKLAREIFTLGEQRAALEKELQTLSHQAGAVRSRLEAQRTQQTERDRLVRDFTSRFHVPGYETSPYTPEQTKTVMALLDSMLVSTRERIAQMKAIAQADVARLTTRMDALQGDAGQLSERRAAAARQMRDNDTKVSALQRHLSQQKDSVQQITDLERQLNQRVRHNH